MMLLALASLAGGCASSGLSGGPREVVIYVAQPHPQILFQPADDGFEDDMDLLEAEYERKVITIADPLEGWNRLVFQFNDGLYVHVGRPVLVGYEALVHQEVREAIGHAFRNLQMPQKALNALLQGDIPKTQRALDRFFLNTTIGILGFRDVARSEFGIEPVDEDLGQTLAVWGLGDGVYLVWPVLGPASLRDSAGAVGDSFLNPIRYIPPCELSAGISGYRGLNAGSLNRKAYEALRDGAVDPYVAFRQAYIEYRAQQIRE